MKKNVISQDKKDKKYTFKSFTEILDNLHINISNKINYYVDNDINSSYFGSSLEEWKELNLSPDFITFSSEICIFSQSLPQILYHKQKIFDIITSYISKGNSFSLEPFLSLLVSFSRDLKEEFNPFIIKTFEILESILINEDVNVIEWTFNSIAYLFKYSLKIVLNNFEDIFQILSKLLHKNTTKLYIIRYTAEAIAFLFKRIDDAQKILLIKLFITDLQKNFSNLYLQGISLIISESCKNIKNTLNSKATKTINHLIELWEHDFQEIMYLILKNTIISLINHTNEVTFFPIIETLLVNLKKPKFHNLDDYYSLLLICISAQNGKKVRDWKIIIDHILPILSIQNKYSYIAIKLITNILCLSDINTIISYNKKIMDYIELSDINTFKMFFKLALIMPANRFNTFLLGYFYNFICRIWETHQDDAIYLLLSISNSQILIYLPENPYVSERKKIKFSPNHYIFQNILEYFEELTNKASLEIFIENKISIWKRLKLLSCIDFNSKSLNQILYKLVIKYLALEFNSDLVPIIQILLTELSSSKCDGLEDNDLINLFDYISESSKRFSENILFLQGISAVFEDILTRSLNFNNISIETLFSNIISNLLISGSQRRFYTIKILTLLYKLRSDIDCEILKSCNIIAETPLAIESLRTISLYIRRISINFSQAQNMSQKITIIFLIGLMTVNFSSISKDCSSVLASLYNKNYNFIWKYIFDWIKLGNIKKTEFVLNKRHREKNKDYVFRCFKTDVNLDSLQIEQNTDEEILLDWKKINDKDDLDKNNGSTEYRSHALKILLEIPNLAEEHSRDLVPIFLSIFSQDRNIESMDLLDFNWSQIDKSNLITIFSKFKNPKSLFKSKDIYDAQLLLLSQGDIKIQNLALNCILSWKSPKVLHYENNLRNLLDTTAFRDELANIMQENSLYDFENQQLFLIVLRILYGRMISRSNSSSRKHSLSTKREIILSSLTIFPSEIFKIFLNIMIEPFSKITCIDKSNSSVYKLKDIQESIEQKKQIGFCRVLKEVLKQIGSKIMLYLSDILNVHFYCWNDSESIIESFSSMKGKNENICLKYAKTIRHICYQNLNKMFSLGFSHEWKPYMALLFVKFINPRLKNICIDSLQAPSGLLKIFSTWSENANMVHFLYDYNEEIVLEITKCLSSYSIKEDVVLFIFDFYRKMILHANMLNEIPENGKQYSSKEFFLKHISIILNALYGLLIDPQRKWTKNIYQPLIDLLSLISLLVNGSSQVDILLETNISIISKFSKFISEFTKNNIFETIQNLLPLSQKIHTDYNFFHYVFETLIPMFGTLKNRNTRITLSNLINMFSKINPELTDVSNLILDLNSLSSTKLDQPDFNRILSAFTIINDYKWKEFNIDSWALLIHNMIFFIQDEEEFSIRINASYTMKKFIERFKDISITEREAYLKLLSSSILKALKREMKLNKDLVRQEYLSILAHVAKFCNFWVKVSDLQILLVGDDEEANFFNNILHVQQHRRIRALRRLCIASSEGKINKNNISQIFLPLTESLCIYSSKQYHNLVSEAIKSIGIISSCIHWNQYYTLFRRYIKKLKNNDNDLKITIRIIDSIADALFHSCKFSLLNSEKNIKTGDSAEIFIENGLKAQLNNNNTCFRLKDSITDDIPLKDIICSEFIPPLVQILRKIDISTIASRVPIALTITKLSKCLNHNDLLSNLLLVLSEICKILQSRSQDHRDIARKILSDIIGLLGPHYLLPILIELKNTLKHGYQLHVLGFTMHTLLYRLQENSLIGSINNCTDIIAEILVNDIFGNVGMEKKSEEYISSMKEVKTNKSYDSFEILSSIINLEYLSILLKPIFRLLHKELTLEILKSVDIVFKRVNLGILKNSLCYTHDGLRLCYNLFQKGMKGFKTENNKETDKEQFAPELNLSIKKTKNNFSKNSYKIIKFSLDLLKGILSKDRSLISPENLIPFIPIIGDMVLSGNEDVHISALNTFIIFLKLDIEQVNSSLNVFVNQAFSFIKLSASTNTELCQTSLKFLTHVFKSNKNIEIKEGWLAYIITKIKLDIEEPDRQDVTFSIIKAIMSRKYIFPELYDLIDSISNILVTSQSKVTRNMARGIYYQFLLDYPQGKSRLKKQISFLVRNLEYEHASGRQSIIETMNLIISNFEDSVIEEFLELFFIALMMVIANDSDRQSRTMSSILLQKIFKRSNSFILKFITGSLKTWLDETEKKSLRIAAIQGYNLLFQALQKTKPEEIYYFLEKAQSILNENIISENSKDYELIYQIMLTMFNLIKFVPEIIMSSERSTLWKLFIHLLTYQNHKISLISAEIIEKSFSFCKSVPKKMPLISPYGLSFTQDDLNMISNTLLHKFHNSELNKELSFRFSKNLLFIARFYYLTNAKISDFDSSLYIHPKLEKFMELKNIESLSCLEWLIFRLCIILKNEKNINSESVIISKHQIMELIRALINFLSINDLKSLANIIISPLYKYTDNKVAMAKTQKDLKHISEKVLNELHSKIGTTLYIQIFNNIRQESLKIRQDRKLKRSILSVSNPEKLARKKIKLNIKKMKSRRRKFALFHLKNGLKS
ncbi:hypothetical protein T552_01124 [Pneumocystis carinii B80]|uniref:Uncharacterized protein n=1 Tax=Pneumocystis carinii (strain B80) TaxID=1408658 RepID=A0A0W4ZLA8_PNEC8|nr:hypothetical protein T552_01124 [Pneumocystis carinii B80]KTW29167.1 hypothetical protein T552_01124 [Pneumocystis carinii B80]